MGDRRRPTVFVHVGAPKSGTSYLQGLLWKNRDALRRDGLLVPGEAAGAHYWASLDLRGHRPEGGRHPRVPGAWRRLVDEVRDWGGPAVVDHETFSRASEEHVDRAMADLLFADVHVVCTVRHMAGLLPASWQERVKRGASLTFEEFLARVFAGDDMETAWHGGFWSAQDIPAVLARWSRGVPAHRVHVVTVPTAKDDPGLLWRRFASVVGVEPSRYDSEVRTANVSLGAVEAAAFRRLNAALLPGESMSRGDYTAVVQHPLARAFREREGARITLPPAAFDWAVDWAERTSKAVSEAGYDVVGDLAEVVPQSRPEGLDPDDPGDAALAEATVQGMATFARGWQQSRRRVADLERRLARAERERAEAQEAVRRDAARQEEQQRPGALTRRYVVDMARHVPGLGALLRVRRRVRAAVGRRVRRGG